MTDAPAARSPRTFLLPAALHSRADFEEQLRRRLRFVLIMGVIAGPGLSISSLVLSWHAYVAEPSRLFTSPPFAGLLLPGAILDGIFALLLAPHRAPGLRLMRTIEAIVFGVGCALLVWVFPRALVGMLFPDRGLVFVIAQACSALWIALMFMYAIFIPNTWRRCAAALGIMLTMALAPDFFVLLRSAEVSHAITWIYLSSKTLLITMTALMGVYGAYRVDILRRDAAEARQLGQYVLKRELGSGGMGEVHLAEHQFLRRPCAVKLIQPGRHADAEVIARFEREVQATATLTHPNTVQVYDYGRADDGTFFYAMEYLPGLSLEQLVEQDGPLSPGRAVHFLVQICGALEEAHTRGLIHRDIKPTNVIVCERGGVPDVAKLLDFGLVIGSGPGGADTKLTQAGAIVGTPAFMSPEQCGGEAVITAASDIYSIGALAFYLLTGTHVFAGKTAMQTLVAHLHDPPPSVRDRRSDLPAELDAVIQRCLAKSPSDRYPSAAAVGEAFTRSIAANARPADIASPSGIYGTTVTTPGKPRLASD